MKREKMKQMYDRVTLNSMNVKEMQGTFQSLSFQKQSAIIRLFHITLYCASECFFECAKIYKDKTPQ